MLEEKKILWSNQIIREQWYEDENGLKQGEYKLFHYNGIICEKGQYIDGKREGKWEEHDIFGHFRAEKNYKNDKLNGEYKEYFPNVKKTICKIGQYVDDKKEGEWIEYHNNLSQNKISLKENYVNDKLEGLILSYYENGQLMKEENYKDGKREGEYKSFYENGQIKQSLFFKDYRADGEYFEYSKNGNIERTGKA